MLRAFALFCSKSSGITTTERLLLLTINKWQREISHGSKLSSKNKLNPFRVSILSLVCRIPHSILLGNTLPPRHCALFPKFTAPSPQRPPVPDLAPWPCSNIWYCFLEGPWPPWLPGSQYRAVPWYFLYCSIPSWAHWLLPVLPKCRHCPWSLPSGRHLTHSQSFILYKDQIYI